MAIEGGAEKLCDGTGLGRHEVVAARGGADDEVELVGRHARGVQGRAAGRKGELVQGLGGAQTPLGDARALRDPLVRGLEKLGELVIGDRALRKRRPRAQYAKTHVRLPS